MMVINGLFAVIFLLIILVSTVMAVGFMGLGGLLLILVGLVISPSNWAPVVSFFYAYNAYMGRDE